ncbi:hypothetical protein Micbo1qcDRAFT_71509 [Microdochium bolleyi]|uniref:Oxidation resistance protein 1 n=1 Tax=Microdochium bolleyi TaxID=196109 RepID=A0A136J0B5_9PEZI|nr:hypothetical protein Micbo1qcDRAFT_71509 [Microdochium bolleyi]
MTNHHHSQGNLIDVSPPSSGYSTPQHPYAANAPQAPAASYGFGSAVLGLWRRLSSPDEQQQQQQQQQQQDGFKPAGATSMVSSMFSSISGDGINGAFTPPRRQASPVGLPSLGALSLVGFHYDTQPEQQLLNRGIAEEIRTFLPERLKISDSWRLVYSLYQNGSSLGTLYKLCDEYRGRRVGYVLVVRDGTDSTFGAYLTDTPHPAHSYYGTGECFLWRAELHAALPPPPSADTSDLDNYRVTTIASTGAADDGSSSHLAPAPIDPTTNKAVPPPVAQTQSIRFQNFSYSGINDYCIQSETGFLSVGGGNGKYGLWLNDSLSKGRSGECETFLNRPLSDEGEKFDIMGVELWVIGAS